jgi:hypothetical protein
MGVATAIVGSAIIGGIVQSNAASSAAKAQERAANNQLDAAERQYWNDIALATEMKQVLMGLSPTERIEKQADLDNALAKLERGEDVETARLDISRLQNQLAAEGLIDKRFAETREQLGTGTSALISGANDAMKARLSGINIAIDTTMKGFGQAQGYIDSFANEMQGQYDRWNSIYGTLQENLGEFYNNLTPQMLSATNLQMRQREYQTAVDTVRKNFAQRGVASGAQSAIEAGMAMENAKARAQIRADAPFQVAEAQTGFLASTSNIRNAYTDDLQQGREAQADLAVKKAGALAQLDLAAGNVIGSSLEATAQAKAAGAQAGAGLSLDQLNAETSALNAAARNTSAAGQNLTSTAINVAGQQGQIQANLAQQQANAITGVLNTGMYALGKYGGTSTPSSPAPVYDGFTGQRIS